MSFAATRWLAEKSIFCSVASLKNVPCTRGRGQHSSHAKLNTVATTNTVGKNTDLLSTNAYA